MLVERRRSVASQATAILAERIRTQMYPPGARLPSESELAVEMGVSRASIRTALGQLATQGLVLRKQGDGTYVNVHVETVPTSLSGLWNFLRLIEMSGRRPSIEVLAQTVRAASSLEQERLLLPPDGQVFCLQRVFFADDVPVILASNALPLDALRVPPLHCDGHLPIDEFIHCYSGAQIAYDIFDISASLPDVAVRAILRLNEHEPIIALAQVFYDRDNQPLLCGSTSYNDKLLSLRLVQSWS
ncbi:MAG: GntR family transcriptional regulator [Anaerolineae bacterium]